MTTAYWTDLAVCAFAVVAIWVPILVHDYRRRKRRPMATYAAKPWNDPRCSIRQFRNIADTTKERQAR